MSLIPVKVVTSMRNIYEKTSFVTKEKAPLILRAVHIGLGLATIVLACKATTKLPAIMDEAEQDKENLDECIRKAENGEIEFTDEDIRRETIAIKKKTAVKVIKAYLPALLTYIVSEGAYAGEAKLNADKIAGLTAVCAAKSAEAEEKTKALEELKQRIDIPEKPAEGEEDVKADPTDQVKIPPAAFSIMFDETNDNYSKAPGVNDLFFDCMLTTLNEDLKKRVSKRKPGIMTLNEVYRRLGFRDRETGKILQTDAGQIVGWSLYYDESDNKKYGAAGFISFGTMEKAGDGARLLIFNVDTMPLVGRGAFHNEKINNWSEAIINA